MTDRGRARRHRRRRRTQRARRGHHPGPCRALGPRLRGGREDRRRDTDRGADAPRVPPRRLLDDHAAGARLAVLPDRGPGAHAASSSSNPTRRSPTRSTAAGRPCWSGRRGHRGRAGRRRRAAWRRLFGPLVRAADDLGRGAARARRPRAAPPARCSPGSACRRCAPRTGWPARRSAARPARALFAGVAAHSMLRLDRPLSASFGLVLGDATRTPSAGRWSAAASSAVADALAGELTALGGEIVTGHRVDVARRPCRLRAVRAPRHDARASCVAIADDDRVGRLTRQRGADEFRYGAGVFKVDWALDGPVPVDGRGSAPRGDGPPRRDARGGRGLRGRRRGGPPSRSAVRAVRAVRAVGSDARRRTARPRPGRTATSRGVRRWT